MPHDFVARVRDASQAWEPDELFGPEEIELLRGLRLLLDAGIPEEAIIQGIRVTADALGRVAENEGRLFHYYVHERLRASGLSGSQLAEATRAASTRSMPLMEPTILYFHRRGLARAAREDLLLHLEEELSEPPSTPATMRVAVLFVDLSSFTPLTQAMGDDAAAAVLDRFGRLVRDIVKRYDGNLVKQIGDAFMAVFRSAQAAVSCALEIERRSLEESQLPAIRSGIHYGEVLYRDGDYVGTLVNLASRLTGEASPHQVVVTDAVRAAVRDDVIAEYAPIGRRQLKGIAEPVALFDVRPATGIPASDKTRDPVCGMELRPAEVAVRMSMHGRQLSFCSDECLRRYVAQPERYATDV